MESWGNKTRGRNGGRGEGEKVEQVNGGKKVGKEAEEGAEEKRCEGIQSC